MNVIKACEMLIKKYNSVVPDNRADLEALRCRTQNGECGAHAFGQPTMAVDTHIFRVGNRTGLAVGKTYWRSSIVWSK